MAGARDAAGGRWRAARSHGWRRFAVLFASVGPLVRLGVSLFGDLGGQSTQRCGTGTDRSSHGARSSAARAHRRRIEISSPELRRARDLAGLRRDRQGRAQLILGRDSCGTWDGASRYEWLGTHGLGGFACGTPGGPNTRRYHGFLVASLIPPVERTLLVAKVEVSARYLGQCTDLSANEF